eukprot:6466116-Amphidinium_carterae.1
MNQAHQQQETIEQCAQNKLNILEMRLREELQWKSNGKIILAKLQRLLRDNGAALPGDDKEF